MNNFDLFIQKLELALKAPLPGRDAQFLMEPHTRRIELNKQKDRINARLSSVLILLYQKNGNTSTVMIKRPVYDGVHSGQIAFPGGRFENTDKNLTETALRETEEEIGVNRNSIY